MKGHLVLGAVLLAPVLTAAAPDYRVTVLKPDAVQGVPRPEYRPSAELVGKTIAAVFGPVAEIRVELNGPNITGIERDAQTLEKTIRARIDRSKCVGRESEVAWHKAPWVRGYVLLENGRILPIEIMLSGVVVGDFLFAEKAE